MSSPMFYDNVVALDKQTHKNLKLSPKRNLSFAKSANSVTVAGFEFFEASRNYPIFFVKNSSGDFLPLAILSFRKDGHELGEEAWSDVYIPAYMRRYPFMLATDGVVVIDDKSDHLVEDEGLALFNEDGEPTEEFSKHLEFLDAVDKGFKRTEEFCKALSEKELLKAFDSKLNFPQGTVNLGEVYVIDEKLLHEKLDQTEVHEWFNKGWIAWAHAHLHSINSVNEVMKRAVQAASADQAKTEAQKESASEEA